MSSISISDALLQGSSETKTDRAPFQRLISRNLSTRGMKARPPQYGEDFKRAGDVRLRTRAGPITRAGASGSSALFLEEREILEPGALFPSSIPLIPNPATGTHGCRGG
jgi:hypothetical protein